MSEQPSRAKRRQRPARRRHGRIRSLVLTTFYGLLTVAALVVGSLLGEAHGTRVEPKVVLGVSAAVFVLAGIVTTRRLARGLEQAVGWRASPSTGSAFRVVASVAGYVIILFATLGLVSVPLSHVAVGGAIVGIVIGIAAQQALGNLFAGAVLLLARPFRLGDHIRIRSGALGGEFDGVVRAMNLTYVMLRTEQGLLHVPNSAVLAAAVGPWRKPVVISPADVGPPTVPMPTTPTPQAATPAAPIEATKPGPPRQA